MIDFVPLFGILAGIASMFVVAWIIYVIIDGFRRREQVRATAEFQTRLLDRMGSARDFSEFLNSDGGAKFLESLATTSEGGPQLRILKALQSGAVTLFVGLAIFIYTDLSQGSLDPGLHDFLNLVASIMTAIGLALLLSSAMSLVLSRRMGLINGKRGAHTRDSSQSV